MEKDRQQALEGFSGLSLLGGLAALLQQFSQSPDLASAVSSPVLSAQILPVLRCAPWHLAPAAVSDLGNLLSSQLSCWKQAVVPLPTVAQSTLLSADPFLPGFGSQAAVTEALARAPQVAVVYQGRTSAPPPAARGRLSSAPRRPSSSRPSAAPPRPRQDGRYHQYPPSSSRPAPPLGARRPLPARDSSTSSRRREMRPFRASASGPRGARR